MFMVHCRYTECEVKRFEHSCFERWLAKERPSLETLDPRLDLTFQLFLIPHLYIFKITSFDLILQGKER